MSGLAGTRWPILFEWFAWLVLGGMVMLAAITVGSASFHWHDCDATSDEPAESLGSLLNPLRLGGADSSDAAYFDKNGFWGTILLAGEIMALVMQLSLIAVSYIFFGARQRHRGRAVLCVLLLAAGLFLARLLLLDFGYYLSEPFEYDILPILSDDDCKSNNCTQSGFYIATSGQQTFSSKKCSTFASSSVVLRWRSCFDEEAPYAYVVRLSWILGRHFGMLYHLAAWCNVAADLLFLTALLKLGGASDRVCMICGILSFSFEMSSLALLLPAAVFHHGDCLLLTNSLGISLDSITQVFSDIGMLFVVVFFNAAMVGFLPRACRENFYMAATVVVMVLLMILLSPVMFSMWLCGNATCPDANQKVWKMHGDCQACVFQACKRFCQCCWWLAALCSFLWVTGLGLASLLSFLLRAGDAAILDAVICVDVLMKLPLALLVLLVSGKGRKEPDFADISEAEPVASSPPATPHADMVGHSLITTAT